MNTWIWGPPTWKFLHTLSFSPRVRLHPNADRAAQLLILLQYVLPCSFCRDSYALFFRNLQRQFSDRSLRDIIAHGQLAEWMYALHQMVNNKLNYQILTRAVTSGDVVLPSDEGATPQYLTQLLQERQISFECLVKRFRVRPVAFSDSDVWDMLKMFALNLDSVDAPNSREREVFNTAWVSFVEVMPHAVEVAGGSPSLVSALVHVAQLTGQLRARRRAAAEGAEGVQGEVVPPLPASTDTFLHCVVAGFKKQLQEHEHRSCHCTGSSNGESSVSTTLQRTIYEVARAKVCKDGSCK